MYTSKFATALLLLVFVSPMASASPQGHKHQHKIADHDNHHPRYAKVLFVKPVYRSVRIEQPLMNCRHRNVNHSSVTVVHQHSPENIILGGVLGGIIGHELGNAHNRDISTLAGVAIGSALAHDISSTQYVEHNRWEDRQPHCRKQLQIIEREELVGYKVKYKYRGQIFTTHSHHHPGKRILVQPTQTTSKSFVY